MNLTGSAINDPAIIVYLTTLDLKPSFCVKTNCTLDGMAFGMNNSLDDTSVCFSLSSGI